jgi:Domain of unknown function (DUF4276)
MHIEVLTEGASDVPVLVHILTTKFSLIENVDFRIHPHNGRGNLPSNPLKAPERQRRGLLDQLPAKLRGYGKSLNENDLVLVLLDADDDDCKELLKSLTRMLNLLPTKPTRVLFRLAIEETESWFLADADALQRAFPNRSVSKLRAKKIRPDERVGAWERLAEHLGAKPNTVTGQTKILWAQRIAPHLDLVNPKSPSLGKLLSGISRELANR